MGLCRDGNTFWLFEDSYWTYLFDSFPRYIVRNSASSNAGAAHEKECIHFENLNCKKKKFKQVEICFIMWKRKLCAKVYALGKLHKSVHCLVVSLEKVHKFLSWMKNSHMIQEMDRWDSWKCWKLFTPWAL